VAYFEVKEDSPSVRHDGKSGQRGFDVQCSAYDFAGKGAS